jgi:hypothetical protein
MRPYDGAVKAPLLFFFSTSTEAIQSDRLAVIKVAGDDEKYVGRK